MKIICDCGEEIEVESQGDKAVRVLFDCDECGASLVGVWTGPRIEIEEEE